MGLHDVRRMDDIKTLSVLNAYSESMPTQLSLEHDWVLGSVAIFTPPLSRLRVLGVDPGQVNRMVLTGQMRRSESGPVGLQGTGVLVSDTPGRTALDFWTRDDEKLEHLRKNSITPEATLALHAEAQRLKEASLTSTGARARALSQASWSISQKVYPAVRSISTDVVYSLIIMLLLCIPFSVLCERLFLSGATISRRIIGFFVIFLATFFFFYFLHPAFGLAQKPTIIFLAFVIMATSAVVIGLLSSRFSAEMEAIQLESLGMHKVDVSRLGTLFATVALGIGNMRRRPTRTFLTALTVILMTFILMTFASFNNSNAVRRRTHVDPPPYNGLLVSRTDRVALHQDDINLVKEIAGDRAIIHLRYWQDSDVILQGPKISVALKGLLAIAPGDPSRLEETLLGPGNTNGFSGQKDLIFVTPKVRSLLGVSLGENVMFFGRVFKVGLINEEALARTTDIGGLGVTPFAKLALSQEMQETLRNTEAMAGIDIANYFSNQAPDDVVIIHADTAKEMRMPVTSMVVTPRDPSVDLQALGTELTGLIIFPIQVASDGVGIQMTAVDAMSVSGLTQVLLPLFLGGMIIFSTMLGSVAERGREIFIYASLGLAPIHIAVLFLVEAAIYAILGGMGGYMLAQVVGAVIGLLAKWNLVGQIDINYSSFGAVLVMLMIMGVVLFSALYPAIIAARSAKPGEDADFRVPEPTGDRLDIPFPFTVARQDIGGLMRFLQHWLGAHTEATTGTFTADMPQETIDGQTVTTQCRTWLAPFDLGISQRFALSAKPTDMKAIFALHLRLDLLSGQRSSWRTVLGPFLQEMRQQFLVWRTLDEATRDGYRAKAGDVAAIDRIEARRQAAAEALKAEASQQAKLDEAMKEKAGLTKPQTEAEGKS
jgi:cell division protein FtsX